MVRIQLENVYNVLSVMPPTEKVLHERQLIKLLKEKPSCLEGRKGLTSCLEAPAPHICLYWQLVLCSFPGFFHLHHKSVTQCFSNPVFLQLYHAYLTWWKV